MVFNNERGFQASKDLIMRTIVENYVEYCVCVCVCVLQAGVAVPLLLQRGGGGEEQ